MSNKEVNKCDSCEGGRCEMGCGGHNHECGAGICMGGCTGHRIYMAKRLLMIAIVLGIFWLGTAVGELKSMKRSEYRRNHRMMNNYYSEYDQDMMWYGTESASTVAQPQTKTDTTVKTTTPTIKK
jgi:hypothetical protein